MSRTPTTELEPLVGNFEHLSHKPRASEALHALRKVASMVKPIMRQRNWRVGTLAELDPKERDLLGLNTDRGRIIHLRLRHAGDETQFMPLENVVDTMLHELSHIVHGPHDEKFHALWDKLRDEQEALMRKGYTGEGFLGKGQRVGGHRVPMAEVRRQARAAAERRKALNAGSGQRLGGRGVMRGEDARTVIADAVERRLKISKACGSNTERGRQIARDETQKGNVTRTHVDHEDANEAAVMQAFIELIQQDEEAKWGKDYVPPSRENPAGLSASALVRQQKDIENQLRTHGVSARPLPETYSPPPGPPPKRKASPVVKAPAPEPEVDSWTCPQCTLLNPKDYLMCEVCYEERPALYNTSPHQFSSLSTANRNQSSTSRGSNQADSKLLKPKSTVAESLAKFEQQGAYKKALPIGWKCGGCGNFMEQEWWTCSVCGRMKQSS